MALLPFGDLLRCRAHSSCGAKGTDTGTLGFNPTVGFFKTFWGGFLTWPCVLWYLLWYLHTPTQESFNNSVPIPLEKPPLLPQPQQLRNPRSCRRVPRRAQQLRRSKAMTSPHPHRGTRSIDKAPRGLLLKAAQHPGLKQGHRTRWRHPRGGSAESKAGRQRWRREELRCRRNPRGHRSRRCPPPGDSPASGPTRCSLSAARSPAGFGNTDASQGLRS